MSTNEYLKTLMWICLVLLVAYCIGAAFVAAWRDVHSVYNEDYESEETQDAIE